MASQNRRAFAPIEKDLLNEGFRFSFFQVIRLLRLFNSEPFSSERQEPYKPGQIRIKPDVSLGFPAADVATVEKAADESAVYQVTATFLGLYGASSPLPTFYSEDILDEVGDDESVTRDFIDIIHNRIFSLLFRCWTKYRQFIKVAEENSPQYLERLFCLLGLGEKKLREAALQPYRLMRYIGLLTQFPRSAMGLCTLLRDALGEIPVQFLPCVKRKAKIPEDQRLFLGTTEVCLGRDSFLGEEIEDRMGKFRLQIGPVNRQQFRALLPEGEDCKKLAFLTRFYVVDSVEYDVELTLVKGEAQSVCLGRPEWSRLGWDTWLFAGDDIGEIRATFYPE